MSTAVVSAIESSHDLPTSARAKAPLRLVMTIPVKNDRETALRAVLAVERVAKWVPSIKKAEVIRDASGTPSARVCTVQGMGKLTEAIVWFDESKGYAYAAEPSAALPMTDHLCVATVGIDASGVTTIRWAQHFNWRGFLKPLMMKLMFPGMMRSLGKGLQRELGPAGPIRVSWV